MSASQPYLIPEGLPPSTIERPHPVSSGDPSREGSVRPFAALLERVSRNLEGQDAPEPDEPGEEFMAHAAFERERYPESPTDCGGMLRFADQSGAMWPAVCDVCDFEVCVAIEKFDPAKLIERRLARCGIPEGFVGVEFEKGDPAQQPALEACRLWIRGFRAGQLAEAIPAVALYGKAGRGKSHLLSLIVDTIIRQKSTEALYWSASALWDALRAGIESGSEEAWRRALRVPVLALDDLGAGRLTEWQADRLGALVDHRYGKALPLLIATNIPPGGWDKAFGERTGSRLRGMCLRFELCGADRRDPAQQQLLADRG